MSVRVTGFAILLAAAALAGCQTQKAAQPGPHGSATAAANPLDGVRPVTKPTAFTYRPFKDQTYRLTTVNNGKTSDMMFKLNAAAASGRIVVTAGTATDNLRLLMEPNGRMVDFITAGASRDKGGQDIEAALRMLIPEYVTGAVKSGEPITRSEIRTDDSTIPVRGILQGVKEVDGTTYGVISFHIVNPNTNGIFMDFGYSLFDAKTHFPVYTEFKFDKTSIVFKRV